MRKSYLRTIFVVVLVSLLVFSIGSVGIVADASLIFDPDNYTIKSVVVDGQTVKFRAYENIVYVKNPVSEKNQSLNFYVPLKYYEKDSFPVEMVPIFLPNGIGGYMPAEPIVPGKKESHGDEEADLGPNASAVALFKGYVVASPGARGRTSTNNDGTFIGKAPAAIVDLKAAVRYLHFNDEIMPGDATKIISNGTSAGGALSALLGASGNNKDYEPYLEEVGAAPAGDEIFAVSSYCPITNLDNSDMAYEWMFNGVNDYTFLGGGTLNEYQIQTSNKLKEMFVDYLNDLELKKPDGTLLTVNKDGSGNFKDYVESFVIDSIQTAMDNGTDLSDQSWITLKNGTVTEINFEEYVKYITRMKPTPAFDALNMKTWENSLFGTATLATQHFTEFSKEHSEVNGFLADQDNVKMMNAMYYIGAEETMTAKYWRIRHGAADRDTALAVPVILVTKLQNVGADVDFAVPWGQGHGGDYDLDSLFSWIAKVSKFPAFAN